MKKTAIRLCVILLSISIVWVTASATDYLIPGGQVIGLSLQNDSVTVAAIDETMGQPARQAGVCIGDRLLRIDEKTVKTVEDVRTALQTSKGQITLQLQRQGQTHTLKLSPSITPDGPKLGLLLRQGVTGIGTVTFYDPDTGAFGTLGHGVNDAEGKLLSITGGTAYEAAVASVKQGKVGQPGQLRGAVDAQKPLGALQINSGRGVFGKAADQWQGSAVPVATAQEIKAGSATIFSTKSHKPR